MNAPQSIPGPDGSRTVEPVVVGMGASAGGLEALSEFMRCMPADSGLAFVLVLHLDPTHDSIMPELLAKDTLMAVHQVQDETPVEANHVYVIPPNAVLSIEGGVIRVARPVEPRGRRMAIDAFFESLAQDMGPRAVCIVLSGTGSDGSLGLRAIKEHGGLAIAQTAEHARYDSMPRSAIATQLVDYVLPVREMPRQLIAYAQRVRDHIGSPRTVRAVGDDGGDTDDEGIDRICTLLLRRTGHDFSRYKRGTVTRRMERRMRVLQVQSIRAYADRIADEPKEGDALFRDLLISVTQFFRDPEVFDGLREDVMPMLLTGPDTERPVRIWVPGCATGEEAYSLAMLVSEQQHRSAAPPRRVQIFATDIDTHALEFARAGRYPEGIAEHVGGERLARFFSVEGDSFVVRKELREMCLFTPHNVIKDPPFSSLDLISCRNLLIYLENDVQRKLIPVFHYALGSGRFLQLGPTENIASHSNLFKVLAGRRHLYQAKATAVRPTLEFPLSRLARPSNPAPAATAAATVPVRENKAVRALERMLLEHFAPASVVFNEHAEIAYFVGRAGQYLSPGVGTPTNNVVDMAREGLRLPLRTSIYRAVKTQQEVVHERVMVEVGNSHRAVRLTVRPLREIGEANDLYIAVFQDIPEPPGPAEPVPGFDAGADLMARQLEAELRQTREQLQLTIEQMEAGHEELKSSNEELLSMNEELQSSNEQMQTSKEELQSVNEELGTVNAELSRKVDELDRTNADLQNLLESTQIATVFLDNDLRIQRFTPAATQLFRILDTDIGRRITDFAPRFDDVDVAREVREVMLSLAPRQTVVSLGEAGRQFELRLHPYRTAAGSVAGVVLSFLDITELLQARLESARLATIVETSQDAIIGKDLDGTVTSWNPAAARTFGYSAAEAIGRPIDFVMPPDQQTRWREVLERLRSGDTVEPANVWRLHRDGRRVDLHIAYSVMRSDSGEVAGIASIGRDVSQLRRAEERALQRAAEVEALMEAVPAAVWIAHDAEATQITGNRESYRVLNMDGGGNQSLTAGSTERPAHFRVKKDGRELHGAELPIQRSCFSGEPVMLWEEDIVFDDGQVRHLFGNSVPLFDGNGRPRGAVAAFIDITDLKRSQRALDDKAVELGTRVAELEAARIAADEANRAKDRFIAVLSHELRTPLTPVLAAVRLAARERDVLPPNFQRMLDMIDRNVTLEARLIDDLLDLNRLVHGKMRLDVEDVELPGTVADAVEICQGDAAANGVAIVVEVPPGIFVRVDAARMQQLVWNLLRNAIAHSPAGSSVRIEAAHGTPEWATIVVSDQGQGIAADRLPHIFKAFERGDDPLLRRQQGLGLGLAICRAIAVQHGGTVEAHSDGVGKGARFVLTLPAAAAAVPGSSARRAAAAPRFVAAQSLAGRSVLLVEDEPDALASMSMLLEPSGLAIATAHSVESALQALAGRRPDIIVSDIGLPDGTGFDLMLRVRAMAGEIPAIALSGYGMDDDVARARDAGFALHLTKPVDVSRLEEAIATLLVEGAGDD